MWLNRILREVQQKQAKICFNIGPKTLKNILDLPSVLVMKMSKQSDTNLGINSLDILVQNAFGAINSYIDIIF